MSHIQEPTYEELAKALLVLDDAWYDLFGQVCSNPVKNAWGQPVNFTVFNQAREQTSGIVYRLKKASAARAEEFLEAHQEFLKQNHPVVFQPEPDTLQSYLAKSDDHGYNMKDMLLEHFVDQERRRISKSGEGEPHNLESEVETRINNLEIPLVDVLQAAFGVLARVAKGKTE
ncbi:hypothetical protein DEEACLCL_00079 [Salmonella phage CRW-SP2]|nr:hypothetical protein DEEACLCL_00079 [Salmonella phage CRW-SP2]